MDREAFAHGPERLGRTSPCDRRSDDPLARWVLRAAAFLLPLAFLPNIVDEFVLPKLLLARLLIAVSLVVLLVRWLRQGSITWVGSVERRVPLCTNLSLDVCDHVAGVRNVYLAPFYDIGDAYLEGLCLVNAMHITASVFINDDEPGLHADYEKWLEQLAPHAPTSQYLHNRTGEDNADAHMKRQVMGREVVVAITRGKLDFGPWEQIFYGEFDGGRKKRALIKIIGE